MQWGLTLLQLGPALVLLVQRVHTKVALGKAPATNVQRVSTLQISLPPVTLVLRVLTLKLGFLHVHIVLGVLTLQQLGLVNAPLVQQVHILQVRAALVSLVLRAKPPPLDPKTVVIVIQYR